jgi:hypothetical protein
MQNSLPFIKKFLFINNCQGECLSSLTGHVYLSILAVPEHPVLLCLVYWTGQHTCPSHQHATIQ